MKLTFFKRKNKQQNYGVNISLAKKRKLNLEERLIPAKRTEAICISNGIMTHMMNANLSIT